MNSRIGDVNELADLNKLAGRRISILVEVDFNKDRRMIRGV